jgi:hypothetical protein
MIGGALEWLASRLARLTAMSSMRLLVVLALVLAALYARRVMTMGATASRAMTVLIAVALTLAAGIVVGAIDPNLSALAGLIVTVLETVREVAA